jgi:spore germination cell wall hydrolase CwlJ-like protein
MARALASWSIAAALLVSFTATANHDTSADVASPSLRFSSTSAALQGAWPTLTSPDVEAAQNDFLVRQDEMAPQVTVPAEPVEPWFRTSFWRQAWLTDLDEVGSEAAPDVVLLFDQALDALPMGDPFQAGAVWRAALPPPGAFSGWVAPPAARETETPTALAPRTPGSIVALSSATPGTVARAAIASLPPTATPAAINPVRPLVALPPRRPSLARSPLVGTVTSEREMQCLAEAVYWEARSESERGQAAVAQVVLNRARSGVYPSTVCGVVYQNRHRYLACQFTFACEGRVLRITEEGSWRTAQRIARDVAEGRTYLPGVGNASHYHANYVRPWWARYMQRRETVGSHIFYFETAEN